MKNNWLFNTVQCAGKAVGESPSWRGQVIKNGSVGSAQIVAEVADELGMDAINVLNVIRTTDKMIIAHIRRSETVNMELAGFNINLIGSFDGSDATFDLNRNMLRVSTYAKPVLRDCLKNVTPRNVTHGLRATIFSIQDNVSKEEGVVTVASKILVAGTNIYMDPANDDEWCGLFTKAGELVARATVLRNDSATADISFNELPEDGDYIFTIFARNGAPTDRMPATARRAVKVRKAS